MKIWTETKSLRRTAGAVALAWLIFTTGGAAAGQEGRAVRNAGGRRVRAAAAGEQNQRRVNRAVVESFFSRLEAMDIPGFVALWAEDGVQVMPFSPAGFPKELRGRAAILKQYGGLPANYTGMRFPGRVVHETADPEVFVVEYRGEITVKATGKLYNNDYVGIFHVKGGRLVRFVEYFNPIVLQESFGADLQKNFNVDKK